MFQTNIYKQNKAAFKFSQFFMSNYQILLQFGYQHTDINKLTNSQ